MVRVIGASTIVAIIASLACALPAWAQPAPVAVQIIERDDTVAVQILQTAPLTAVLGEFCRQTHADCEGADAAANIELAPINVVGSWEQVMAKLMEGTHMNYVAMPATAASGARLLITGRALSLEAPQATSIANATRSDGSTVSSSGISLNADSTGAAGEDSIASPVAAAEDTGAELAPVQEPVVATAPSDTSPLATTPSPRGSVHSGTATDLMGNPVPQYAGLAYFPFPDGNGELIAASNEPTTWSPFPDSNGSLIPASGEAPSHSNPFPAKPGATH